MSNDPFSSAPPDPTLLDADEVARSLGSEAGSGLAAGVAAQRLAESGPNEFRPVAKPPTWLRLLKQFHDPLVYLLLAAAGIALLAWAIEVGGGVPVDALVIAAVVLLNALLGYVQEGKAADAVAALATMTALTSSVIRDGKRRRIPSAELVPGDLLVLGEGDAVGADARLVQASALRVQEASLTGESEPVLKDAATLAEPTPLAERFCMVFRGTSVTQGNATAVVTATGMRTEMGAIASMLDATREEPTPLQREIAHVGRMLGIAVVAIAVIVVVTILLQSSVRSAGDFVTVLLLGVSLAVAAVPEGLLAILSLVLALGVQRMAKRNALVKSLSSVETLGSASVICSDKTGTLTRSEMTIERVVTASGGSRITGIGYAPVGTVEAEGVEPLTSPQRAEHIVVLSGGSLASNADLRRGEDGRWEIEGDPTEAAFLVAERKLGVTERRKRRFLRVGEIPFTSDRKLMSTIERDHEQDDALVVITKGAPDVLIERCTRVRVGMEVVPLHDERRSRVLADVERLSDEALRVLAVAYRPIEERDVAKGEEELERDLIFVGVVGMLDPPRKEAALAIQAAHRAGIRVLMITGDHPRTAGRIAAQLGIAKAGSQVLTGPELDDLDDASFSRAAREVSVFARVAPIHKLRIVDALQADGQVVAMTGDGVNDAPALKSADIGVAMGIAGTEVSKDAAKMILADDNFATIVVAVREGRVIFDNIRKFLRYLLSSNMGEVLTVFLGVVFAGAIGLGVGQDQAVVLPLLATQILWVNLITDSGPALAMGVDPEADDVMARPPRRRDDRVIDGRMWASVFGLGLVMAVAVLATIDLYLPGGMIEGLRSLDQSRTAGFTVLVFAQLFNCFNARSETSSAFRNILANHWLWSAVALSFLLQLAVVNIGALNVAFGTVPLTLDQWLVCLLMGSVVLWVSEASKWVERHRHAANSATSRALH